jgi:hypothetical protein
LNVASGKVYDAQFGIMSLTTRRVYDVRSGCEGVLYNQRNQYAGYKLCPHDARGINKDALRLAGSYMPTRVSIIQR